MTQTILSILDELAATTKRKEKMLILNREKDNVLLKKVFYTAYNPEYTFWISKTPEITTHLAILSLDSGIDLFLDNIASRKITGNAAIDFYKDILESLSVSDSVVMIRIISRDLRCGVSVATINKVWDNLIPEYPCMNASSDKSNLVYPCYAQLKYDGMRCEITHNEKGDVILRTRGGNQIVSLDVMYDSIRSIIPVGESWDGELIYYRNGERMSRKESNGILNKALRNTISPKEAAMVRFIAWDVVDHAGTIPYNKRLAHISDRLMNNFSHPDNVIYLTINKVIHTPEELTEYYTEVVAKGEEGIIGKNIHAFWENKRSPNLVKFKEGDDNDAIGKTCDLLVIGWNEGTGQNKGKLGSVQCESSDGKVRVNVGSGFSQKQRSEFTPEMIIDKVIEVKYNVRISKKSGEIDSLFLPRFLKIRFDKNTPNSSQEIL